MSAFSLLLVSLLLKKPPLLLLVAHAGSGYARERAIRAACEVCGVFLFSNVLFSFIASLFLPGCEKSMLERVRSETGEL